MGWDGRDLALSPQEGASTQSSAVSLTSSSLRSPLSPGSLRHAEDPRYASPMLTFILGLPPPHPTPSWDLPALRRCSQTPGPHCARDPLSPPPFCERETRPAGKDTGCRRWVASAQQALGLGCRPGKVVAAEESPGAQQPAEAALTPSPTPSRLSAYGAIGSLRSERKGVPPGGRGLGSEGPWGLGRCGVQRGEGR